MSAKTIETQFFSFYNINTFLMFLHFITIKQGVESLQNSHICFLVLSVGLCFLLKVGVVVRNDAIGVAWRGIVNEFIF